MNGRPTGVGSSSGRALHRRLRPADRARQPTPQRARLTTPGSSHPLTAVSPLSRRPITSTADEYLNPTGDFQVTPQDRGAGVRINFLEAHDLAAAMAQHHSSPGRTDVTDPVRVLAEHRHEIALTLVVGHDHRERNQTAAAAAAHLEGEQAARP